MGRGSRQDRTGCVKAVAWEAVGRGVNFALKEGRGYGTVVNRCKTKCYALIVSLQRKTDGSPNPGPQNVTLLRDGVLNELNEVIRMGSVPIGLCPHIKGRFRHRETQGEGHVTMKAGTRVTHLCQGTPDGQQTSRGSGAAGNGPFLTAHGRHQPRRHS